MTWSAIHQRFGMDIRVVTGFVTQGEAGDWIDQQPHPDEWVIDDNVVNLLPVTNVGPVEATPEEFACLYVGMDDEWRARLRAQYGNASYETFHKHPALTEEGHSHSHDRGNLPHAHRVVQSLDTTRFVQLKVEDDQ